MFEGLVMKNLYKTDGAGLSSDTTCERQMIEKRVNTCIEDILLILGGDIPTAEIESYVMECVVDTFIGCRINKRTELLRKEKQRE